MDDDIAQVDADAQPDVAVFGHTGIALHQADLQFAGTLGGIDGTGKVGQEAISQVLEDVTAVPGDGGLDKRPAMLLQAA